MEEQNNTENIQCPENKVVEVSRGKKVYYLGY